MEIVLFWALLYPPLDSKAAFMPEHMAVRARMLCLKKGMPEEQVREVLGLGSRAPIGIWSTGGIDIMPYKIGRRYFLNLIVSSGGATTATMDLTHPY